MNEEERMRRVLTWIGFGLGALALVLGVVIAGLYLSADRRLKRTYAIEVEAVPIPQDSESLARGEHRVQVLCMGCHRPDLGGGVFLDDPAIGTVYAANLTSGWGGIGGDYSAEDWVRTLRHGVKPDGRSVFIMPSNDFYYLIDQDLGEMIAFLTSVPAVDRETGPPAITPMAKVLYSLGAFGEALYAETIDHDSRPPAHEQGVKVAHGEYLVNISGCRTCHGEALTGGQGPDPEMPAGPNLSPGGELRAWTEADFFRVMRSGETPTGRQLDPEYMPWQSFTKMSDEELSAVWLYLQSLPVLDTSVE
jgi:mono/diheme cytochrome c family protein